jgi:hypothetical protein
MKIDKCKAFRHIIMTNDSFALWQHMVQLVMHKFLKNGYGLATNARDAVTIEKNIIL